MGNQLLHFRLYSWRGSGRQVSRSTRTEEGTDRHGSLSELLKPRILRIIVIGSLLGIFSQISGVNAVMVYAPETKGKTLEEIESQLVGLQPKDEAAPGDLSASVDNV